MSIAIDQGACLCCGACAKICPGSLIKQREDGKAYIKYPRDCWGCSSCMKECRSGAIVFYLGADIGGMGSRMTVHPDNEKLVWSIVKRDGTQERIVVNKKESNQY